MSKAEQALEWLRQQESQVDDEQLFNIGYMIPIVDLAEVECGTTANQPAGNAAVDDNDKFFPIYRQLLEEAMLADQLGADDVAANRQFLTQLEQSLA